MRVEKLSVILTDQIGGEWGDEGDGIAVLRTTNFTNEGRLDLTDVEPKPLRGKLFEVYLA